MRTRRFKGAALCGAVGVWLAVAGGSVAGAQEAQQAGVSAAVRGEVLLARTDAVGRQVESGEAIFLGDAIEAGPDGSLQVLLMDESVFTLGAQSKITIDRFIYDPDGGQNAMTLSMAQGAMRFVAGKIAGGNPEQMQINTPVGQIGIRGTIGYIVLLPPEQAAAQFPELMAGLPGGGAAGGPPVIFAALAGPGAGAPGVVPGSFSFTGPQGSVDLNRPGGAVLATPGAPPVFFIAPPGAIAALGPQGGQQQGGQQQGGQQQGGQQQGGQQQGGQPQGGGQGAGLGGAGVQALGGGQTVPVTQVITSLDQQQQSSDQTGDVADTTAATDSGSGPATVQQVIAANSSYITGSAPITGTITGTLFYDFDFLTDDFDVDATGLTGGALSGDGIALVTPFLPLPTDSTTTELTIGNNGEAYGAATTGGCLYCSISVTFPTTGSLSATVTDDVTSPTPNTGSTGVVPF